MKRNAYFVYMHDKHLKDHAIGGRKKWVTNKHLLPGFYSLYMMDFVYLFDICFTAILNLVNQQ